MVGRNEPEAESVSELAGERLEDRGGLHVFLEEEHLIDVFSSFAYKNSFSAFMLANSTEKSGKLLMMNLCILLEEASVSL